MVQYIWWGTELRLREQAGMLKLVIVRGIQTGGEGIIGRICAAVADLVKIQVSRLTQIRPYRVHEGV